MPEFAGARGSIWALMAATFFAIGCRHCHDTWNMPATSAAPGYWDADNFMVADALNSERWTRSPPLQRTIQPPAELAAIGSVGAQQAMLERNALLGVDANTVLPWVPDLVGKDAQGDGAVLVIGAAYAGFIREYSGRGACLPLADYISATRVAGGEGWAAFQRAFLDEVVRPDRDYYGKLAQLLTSVGITADRVALTDLVPASIVKRGTRTDGRSDDSSQPSGDRAAVFHKYAEHMIVSGWTWHRISNSGARHIIALGHLVEHGLLRLFARQGAMISCEQQPWSPTRLSYKEPECCWVDQYADWTKNLGFWLNPGKWWTVKVAETELRLLPIYHPARVDKYDRGYQRTSKALVAMLAR